MFSSIVHKYRSHKKTILALGIASIFSVLTAYAAPPTSPYTAGETLDPSCAPGDANCSVTISQWDTVTGGINYADGFVGIGTTTPDEALHIYNADNKGIKLERTDNPRYALIRVNPQGGLEYNSAVGVTGLRHDLQIAGVTALGIDASGNVGIGTGTPQAELDVVGEIRATNLVITGTNSPVAAPTNIVASQTCDDGCTYTAEGYAHNYRVYSYEGSGGSRVYSSTYLTLTTDFVDDGSFDPYDITVSWTAASGVDGYRVLKSDDFNGYNFDAGFDTTSTSFVDDGCGNACFDGSAANIAILPNTNYTNSATINGALELSGPLSLSGIDVLSDGSNFVIGTGNSLTGFNNFFVGENAGGGITTELEDVNFIGPSAGYQATNAPYSNFLGPSAGYQATNAQYSNFLGSSAGYQATNSSSSNFLGITAGYQASAAGSSNFIGPSAGYQATNATYSNFLGYQAGRIATNASYSNFLGWRSGQEATNAQYSNFIGHSAGYIATNATLSNFIGGGAGAGATDASGANFIGYGAGAGATDASGANFIGYGAGNMAIGAFDSNFIGRFSGSETMNASESNFIGYYSGQSADNAAFSNFIGYFAGRSATNARNSIFIGNYAGANDLVDNTISGESILIGNNTLTGGFQNSIALGTQAINTAANQFMIGSAASPIDSTRINGSAATQCTITTGTGINCTSDERLKTNIETLEDDTLAKLREIQTVHFNWLGNPSSPLQVGFIAQNLETVFPELVTTDSDGYKGVYYAQMTPILVKAIQELDVKVDDIASLTTESSFMQTLTSWFANAQNGIAKLFAREVETQTLCLSDENGATTCITKGELDTLLGGESAPVPSTPVPVAPEVVETPVVEPVVDEIAEVEVPETVVVEEVVEIPEVLTPEPQELPL